MRVWIAWGLLSVAMVGPVIVAMASPLLAYRSGVYIASGIAGAAALSLLLAQPLLAGGYLPGAHPVRMRRWHRWTGMALLAAVVVHVVGLYLTSPPDVIDALLLASPTPFSIWGVAAMWALILTALMVALRRRMTIRPARWKIVHSLLALVVAGGSVAHALLIEGTMGWGSKLALCVAVLVATGLTVGRLWLVGARPR